jgi:hypothetical protein
LHAVLPEFQRSRSGRLSQQSSPDREAERRVEWKPAAQPRDSRTRSRAAMRTGPNRASHRSNAARTAPSPGRSGCFCVPELTSQYATSPIIALRTGKSHPRAVLDLDRPAPAGVAAGSSRDWLDLEVEPVAHLDNALHPEPLHADEAAKNGSHDAARLRNHSPRRSHRRQTPASTIGGRWLSTLRRSPDGHESPLRSGALSLLRQRST